MNPQTPLRAAVEATETITAPETTRGNDRPATAPQKRSQALTQPGGCRHCGIGQRHHFQQWTGDAGWHGYTAPTNEQRLQRMRDRRATTATQAPQNALRSTQTP